MDVVRAAGLTPETVADAWLGAGVRLLQLRAKGLTLGPALALAETLLGRARAAGARLVINDRADVARLSGADGVHVGQTDLRPAEVRALLPPGALVGLSAHSVAQVRASAGEPVSYLAIGPVFPTRTKARPDPVVGLEGVAAAVAAARDVHGPGVPVVAIGGITAGTAPDVLRAGADAVAVASDLVGPEPGRRARAWLEAVSPKR